MSRAARGATLRLATGDLRGVSVPVPARVRPTSGRVREALMSSWQPRLAGARLLDLFAGSGAVGLEALGRGAAEVVGLEADSRVLESLRRSYERWSCGRAQARRASLPRDLERRAGARFDLVFADPPYDFEDFTGLLAACEAVLAADAEIVVEHSARADLPESVGGLERVRSRPYGESVLSVYRPAAAEPTSGGDDDE